MADPKTWEGLALKRQRKQKEVGNTQLAPPGKDFILQLGIHLIKQKKTPLFQQIIEKKINHRALLGKEKIIFASTWRCPKFSFKTQVLPKPQSWNISALTMGSDLHPTWKISAWLFFWSTPSTRQFFFWRMKKSSPSLLYWKRNHRRVPRAFRKVQERGECCKLKAPCRKELLGRKKKGGKRKKNGKNPDIFE